MSVPNNINDYSEMRSFLRSENNGPGKNDIDDMLYILGQSENVLVCNMVAFKLKDLKDDRILPAIIEVIKRPVSFNKRGKIIYCCENFDCSEYFEIFIDIALEEDGESCLNAIDVIGNMKKLNIADVKIGIAKIEQYITSHKTNNKTPYLFKLKGVLENS